MRRVKKKTWVRCLLDESERIFIERQDAFYL